MFSTYNNLADLGASFGLGAGMSPTGINLRGQMSWILNNTGQWVGWRCFDLTRRSIYWDNIAKEAKGGPPWEYTDYIFKARRMEAMRGAVSEEALQKFGLTEENAVIYFLAYNIGIKEEDLLFHLWDETNKPIPSEVRIRHVLEINRIEPKIDGDLIFNFVKAKMKPITNDMTLHGIVPVQYIAV